MLDIYTRYGLGTFPIMYLYLYYLHWALQVQYQLFHQYNTQALRDHKMIDQNRCIMKKTDKIHLLPAYLLMQ